MSKEKKADILLAFADLMKLCTVGLLGVFCFEVTSGAPNLYRLYGGLSLGILTLHFW